jgi:hypothetical protein
MKYVTTLRYGFLLPPPVQWHRVMCGLGSALAFEHWSRCGLAETVRFPCVLEDMDWAAREDGSAVAKCWLTPKVKKDRFRA